MFEIDFSSDQAIYLQIRDGIVSEIVKGNLKNGDLLPSVRLLAQDLGINPMTVNKAYQVLKDQGYLVIDRRVGARVEVSESDDHKEVRLKKLKDSLQEAKICSISYDEIKKLVNEVFEND